MRGNLVLKTMFVAVAAAFVGTATAQALPAGGTVTAGAATIGTSGPAMTVTQTSQRAILDWSTFNIGSGASVTFSQPAVSSVAVNRVGPGAGASAIDGMLNANGHVMILNPNGVMFGATASVNVGGLIASTGNINDSLFITGGSIAITGATGGSISNAAKPVTGHLDRGITVTGAGLAAFVAPSVSNAGTITALSGRIVLASAQAATISLNGGLYEIAVTQGVANGSISNSGTLTTGTAAGSIVLSALDAANVVSGAINLEGVQQANRIEVHGGNVVLKSDLNATIVTGTSKTIEVYGGAHVQDAIDIATAGTTGAGALITVRPGNYTEIAAQRDLGIPGIYDLGLLVNKENVTIRGVDAGGNAIANAGGVQAWITAGTSTNFGMNHGVIADNVTIEGLGFKPHVAGANKTLEIAGDNFTFRNSVVDNRSAAGGSGALYFGELIAGPAGEITRLAVSGSTFYDGSVSLQNGVGVAADGVTYQPAADRAVTGNTFIGSSNYRFGGLLLTGKMDEVPWRPLPIAAATVTGNSFGGFADSVLVRGEQQGVDLRQIMLTNTFDRAVLVTDAGGHARAGQYVSLNNVTRDRFSIQSGIQAGIDRAVNGDTVNVGAGTYAEQLTVTKSLSLAGAGTDATIIAPASLVADASGMRNILTIGGGPANSVEVSGFTLKGPVPGINTGIFVRDGAHAYIHGNKLIDIREAAALSGNQRGVGILVGRALLGTSGTAVIQDNVITGYQKGGIVVDGPGSQATLTGNTVTGEGPTGVTAQNGIQISRGASATVIGNTVSGNNYTGPDDATGILIFTPGSNLAQGAITVGPNSVSGNEVGIWTNDTRTLTTISLAGATGNTRNAVADFGGGYAGLGTLLEYPAWIASNAALVNATAFGGTQSGDIVGIGGALRVSGWSGFTAIQPAINAVAAGGTVTAAAGSYSESLTIAKALTLDGAGKGLTVINSAGSNVDGIVVQGTIGAGASVAITDLTVQGGRNGIRVADGTTLGTITLDGLVVRDNASNGFISNNGGASATTVANINILNSVFKGNGAGNGSADINLFRFNGTALLSNVDILGTRSTDVNLATDYGLQIRGQGEIASMTPAGNVTLDNVHIAGTYRKADLAIQRYSDAGNIAMDGVVLGGARSAGMGDGTASVASSQAGWGTFFSSDMHGAVSLGNTLFAGGTFGVGDIFIGGGTTGLRVDAVRTGFSGITRTHTAAGAENFSIENRVVHALDDAAIGGVVTWQAGNLYVTQASGSIQRGLGIASAADTVNVGAGTFAENVILDQQRNLAFNTSTIQGLTINAGAAGSGIGGSVTANAAAGFLFNAPVVLLGNTTLGTAGANIALNGDIQNAAGGRYSLSLAAGSRDVSLVSGGTAGNPLGRLVVNSNNFTLSGTLWVSEFDVNALGLVALGNHMLRQTGGGTTNTINAGGGLTGSIVSQGSVQIQSDGDVAANVTAQGDAVVTGNNVSGLFTGNNVILGAGNNANVNVNATTTANIDAGNTLQAVLNAPAANVRADGAANVSGSVGSLVIDAPGGSTVSGSFGQVSNVGGGLVNVNGKPQVNTTLSANADNRRVIPTENTISDHGARSAAALYGSEPVAHFFNSLPPASAGEMLDQGLPVELDLTPGNERRR